MNQRAIKTEYARNHSQQMPDSIRLNHRLLSTYNRICHKLLGYSLTGKNLDLGCGDRGFSAACESLGIQSTGIDYPETDLESVELRADDKSVDFITLNAVIEHIANPDRVLSESWRVLKRDGLIFIRTP
ncbi:MAG: class I SAM-dependent methyltransferase, partial [Deltaproteobacteria bacterium]|nr:class I SAM-dependent methyltransferase [Deltaproteobacteria bacterium]